jgi:hypothetical protein
VDVLNAEHVQRLRRVSRAANDHRMAIIVPESLLESTRAALSRSNRISSSKSTRVDDRVLYLAFHQMYKGRTVARKSIVLSNFGGKATRAFTT